MATSACCNFPFSVPGANFKRTKASHGYVPDTRYHWNDIFGSVQEKQLDQSIVVITCRDIFLRGEAWGKADTSGTGDSNTSVSNP